MARVQFLAWEHCFLIKAHNLKTVLIVQDWKTSYFFLSLTTMTIFIRNKWIYWKRNIDIYASVKFWFGFVELFVGNLKFIYPMMENNWTYSRRWWLNGRVLACHVGDRASIPRQATIMYFLMNDYKLENNEWNIKLYTCLIFAFTVGVKCLSPLIYLSLFLAYDV